MNEAQLFKEFEEKFGFKAYNSILVIFSKMHNRIKRLTASRDNWKKKYEDLKNKNVR